MLGDYVHGRSDVDVLVIVEDPLDDEQHARLVGAVGRERRRAPARVDLRVVLRAVAAAPTPAPPMELHVALDPTVDSGVHVERRSPGERDLVVELSVCRAHGRSLAGPAPSELIAPVPDDWVRAVGAAVLDTWQERPYEPRHGDLMVLTTCRVWRFAAEARHCSKTAAAEWVLGRDPTLGPVRDALRRRRGEAVPPLEESPVRRLLDVALVHVAPASG